MITPDATRIVSFGEGLIDFFPDKTGAPLREASAFEPRLGGAPVNLAYGVAQLGGRAAMVSKLGDDEFGHLLVARLAAVGVNTRGVAMTRAARTGITFVQIAADGERSFLFYRFRSAEKTLTPDDIDLDVVRASGVVHAGTNLLMEPGSRAATLLVMEEARRAGALMSLDANLRLHLWPDPDAITPTVMDAIGRADLLKVNEEELAYLFGDRTPAEAFRDVLAPMGVRALIATTGAAGATVVTDAALAHVPAPAITAIDTTGAGDAFLAALLVCLTRLGRGEGSWRDRLQTLSEGRWRAALTIANGVASQVCTAMGATTAIPSGDAIDWSPLAQ